MRERAGAAGDGQPHPSRDRRQRQREPLRVEQPDAAPDEGERGSHCTEMLIDPIVMSDTASSAR